MPEKKTTAKTGQGTGRAYIHTETDLVIARGVARDEGYQRGYKVGVDEGKRTGFEEGKKIGNAEGFARGKQLGHNEGYRQGYSIGREEAIPGALLEGEIRGNSRLISSIEEIWSQAEGFSTRAEWHLSAMIPAWWIAVLAKNLHIPAPGKKSAKPEPPPMVEMEEE